MLALLNWVRSYSLWRQRPCVSAGLDVGPESIRWVVLSGAEARATTVVCAEHLTVPTGWVGNGRINQPKTLGRWLRQAVRERGYQVDVLSIGIDDALITSSRITLAPHLTQEDLWFQLMAEVQASLADGADVQIDYQLVPEQAPVADLTYQVQSVPAAIVREAQLLALVAGLKLVSMMSRTQADRLAQLPQDEVCNSQTVGADLVVAWGLARSAWAPIKFNLLPHRAMAQQAARRRWLRGLSACTLSGACLAVSMVVMLCAMTDTLQSALPPTKRAAAERAHEEAKLAHDQLTRVKQLASAQNNWLLGRQRVQAATLAWHRMLDQPASGVWVSHIAQKGVQWSVQGEALSSHHAQQWVGHLGELDIWAKSPQLTELRSTSTVSKQGVLVWRYQVQAELKEVR